MSWTVKTIVLHISVFIFLNSCITFKSMKKQTEDPVESRRIEDSLKTDEDIRYWKEVKENNKNAIIVLDDE